MAHFKYVNSKIQEDLMDKYRLFEVARKVYDESEDTIMIFSNDQPWFREIWKSIFRDGSKYHFVTIFSSIPLPDNYQPTQCSEYGFELREYVRIHLAVNGVIASVYNLGTVEVPEMNLLLANRKLKIAELHFEMRQRTLEDGAGSSAASKESSLDAFGSHLSECRPELYAGICGVKELLRMEILRTIVDLSEAPAQGGSASSEEDTHGSGFIRNMATLRIRKKTGKNSSESGNPNRNVSKVIPRVASLAPMKVDPNLSHVLTTTSSKTWAINYGTFNDCRKLIRCTLQKNT